MQVTIVFLCAIFASATCAISDFIKICSLNDEKYSDCVIASINHLRDQLRNGNKELNIPSIEPLEMDKFSFGNILGQSLLATNVSNVKMSGASSFEIKKLVHTPTKRGHTFRIEANIPKIHVAGNYEINSALSNIELHGKGPFTVDIFDYHFECMLKGRKTEIDGNVYLKFGTIQCNSVIRDASVYLHNLFGGNLALEKAANQAISENAASVYQEFRPLISDVIRNELTDVANGITMSIKYDILFPSA